MLIEDPVARIRDDRAQARRLDDTGADVCFLALADSDGRASVRTLVLREIHDNRFLLFMNRSSPKWKILSAGSTFELLLWYHSMQRQYRISGSSQECERDYVRQSWQRRPRGSKYLDLLYEEIADQSSRIESREALVEHIKAIRQARDIDDIDAPEKVAGIEIVADRIEMLDLNREDRIHDRQVFTLEDGSWQSTVLVP
ncbi:MAG: pyridoxamine 5'-phosphate oxidase family protein [Gammaproteobacteria bacterium]|nr:pyridoxamine 5'-phosphate oxidase family protein [Gammaproteobacteria bacterium]